jgi:hypothetical protein
MTRTHVLLHCPTFEAINREVWKDPTTGAFTQLRSIGTLLGNPQWKKRLFKFLEITTIEKVGPDKIDDEIRRITRYEEWCNLVEDSESEDDEAVSHGRNNESKRDHNCSTTPARSLRQISAHLNIIVSFGVYGLLMWLLLCFCRLFIWLLLLLFSFLFLIFIFWAFLCFGCIRQRL